MYVLLVKLQLIQNEDSSKKKSKNKDGSAVVFYAVVFYAVVSGSLHFIASKRS